MKSIHKVILLLVIVLVEFAAAAQPKEIKAELRLASDLRTKIKTTPLPYRIYVAQGHPQNASDEYRLSEDPPRLDYETFADNYMPWGYRSKRYLRPVWWNFQCTQAYKPPRYKKGEERCSGEDNYINAKLPTPAGAKYYIIDAVSAVTNSFNHTFFTLNHKGGVIDKLEASVIFDGDIAIKNAIFDTDTTIMVYELKVLGCKSVKVVSSGDLIFSARRVDTKYIISKNGYFQKVSRVIYAPQTYNYNRNPNGPVTKEFLCFNVDQGREVPLREIEY